MIGSNKISRISPVEVGIEFLGELRDFKGFALAEKYGQGIFVRFDGGVGNEEAGKGEEKEEGEEKEKSLAAS